MDCNHLASLPNEIVLAIIDSLGLKETWSFALASRALYKLSQAALQRHRKYSTKYSTICLGNEGEQPVDFLAELLRDPRIASYIIEMQISKDHDVNKRDEYPEIAALGAGCPWLSEPQQREWQDALLVPKNQFYHLAILLTLLPKLESIKLLGVSYNSYRPILKMVSAIAVENRDPASPIHEKALSALTRISATSSLGENWEFEIYAPFTTLPSMRSLHGRTITGTYYSIALPSALFDQNNRLIQQSQIEEIEMTRSFIDVHTWAWMLRSIKDLRGFTYEHGGNMANVFGEYHGRRIVALLRQHAAHSLEQMDLTDWNSGFWGDREHWGDGLDLFIGDLSDFRILRVLRLMDTVFQRPDRSFVRLFGVLPASIRVVTLVRDEYRWEDRTELFGGLAQGRHRLPELERICLEGGYSLSKDLIDDCKGVGIDIEGSGLQVG
ncbi:MAG: hypothetical protein Q9171_002259 [Xanthocarpia ochracea]